MCAKMLKLNEEKTELLTFRCYITRNTYKILANALITSGATMAMLSCMASQVNGEHVYNEFLVYAFKH